MLLFDDSKKLEKADEKWRQELATKADLQEMRNDIIERITDTNNRLASLDNRVAGLKHEILKWMLGISMAQLALIVGVLTLLK